MNPAAPKYPPKASPSSGSTDVATQKVGQAAPVSTPASSSVTPTATAPAARPVMSAKAAINAMYAAEKNRQDAKLIPSAREAVNAASRLAQRNFKSASNLHHGSLQKVQKIQTEPKSMESTRTSASALLKTAHSDSKNVPVVHTSLKLGANARPKEDPVILPAGARMAQAAKFVANGNEDSTVMINRVGAKQTLDNNALPVKVIPSNRQKLTAAPRRRVIRDPQMLSGGRRVLPARVVGASAGGAENLASAQGISRLPAQLPTQVQGVSRLSMSAVQTGNVRTMPQAEGGVMRPTANLRSTDISPARKLVRPRRFRTAPKNYATADPAAVSADNSYAMSEPPKLAVRRRQDALDEMGVVKNFRPSKLPEPLGDAAPIGRLASQRVASGHGGPAESELAIKAENTSNYSFSRRENKAAKPASYASANDSPFLKSVTVEKRPLSDSSVPSPISLPRHAEPKPEKVSRKNSYQKKTQAADLPTRPTVIVPSSRRSKAPLFFLILITIILGAAVGAAVYLCFFQ